MQEQTLDESKESQPPCDQSNFTCPLPSITSPDQKPTMQEEQQDLEKDSTLQHQTSSNENKEENGLEDETTRSIVKEGPVLENEEEVFEETQRENIETEKEVNKTEDEGDRESISDTLTSDLDLATSTEERRENSSRRDSPTEDNTSSPNPNLHNCIQRDPPPTKGSHLTKHDKRIIEKIRSYYEAAAKAEEDETEEDGEQEEGGESRRRNSFSQIPSGLVKESVSRFDLPGHLGGEPGIEQAKSDTTETSQRESDTYPTDYPVTNPSQLSTDTENNVKAGQAVHSQSLDAEGQNSTVSQVTSTPSQVGLIQNRPAEAEDKLQSNRKVCGGSAEEGPEGTQEGKKSVVAPGQEDEPSITEQNICRDETTKTGTRNQALLNGHKCKQLSLTELNGSSKELSKEPLGRTEQCKKFGSKYQSSWARKKPRDLAKVSGTLDGLHTQSKVGQWSHHSRIVTANRALFEAMGSDVASIGLFETSPEVDPVLIENSERILSKVQTLAQMFGAKASSMKVPLHQKRGTTAQNPSWGTARPSGHSLQSQIKSKTQVESQNLIRSKTECQQEMKMSEPDNNCGTRNNSEAKIQNPNKTYSHSQTLEMGQEEQRVLEEKTLWNSESLTNGKLFIWDLFMI